MAKTRMIKHDLRTSEKVASWPIEIRYFWVLLWGYVDDHGKAKDNPLLVKADCFPLDPDITADTVDGWLWRLTDERVVCRYTVDGTDLLAVVNWPEHQKPPHPTKDVLPPSNDPRAVRRELHASRMKDAGEPSEDFTHELNWVESGFVVEESAHLTAGVTFDDFWMVWGRKVARADAEKAWGKAVKVEDALVILVAARNLWQSPWLGDPKYVPYAATWLNGRRWTDPLPEPPQGAQTAAQRNLDVVAHFAEQQRLEIGQ